MPRLRADQSGQIAPVEIFKYALEILKLIHGFAKGVKKVSEKYVYVPLWKYRYIYHIHEDTRDYVYNEKNHIFNYLDTEDVLKKFGFIFGNEKAVGSSIKDIGVYAFLPFAKIVEFYGNRKIGSRTITNICNDFGENITSDKKKKILDAVGEAGMLLNFILEECCDENFPKLFINPKGHFSEFYNEILRRLGNAESEIKKQVLGKVAKACLLGMYGSSKGFYTAMISAKVSEAGEQIGRVAAMVDGKSYALVEELGKHGFVRKIGDRLVATFEPQTPDEVLQSIFHGIPSARLVFIEQVRFFKVQNLFEAFRETIRDFDKERVPIFLNVYRDEAAGKLRSLCAGYNGKAKKKIQQIKFPKAEVRKMNFGNPVDRFVSVIRKYNIAP